MKHSVDPTGEKSNHKFAAIFDSERDALEARGDLFDRMSLADDQIDVIAPSEKNVGRRLLPDSDGIWQTVLRSHAVFGVWGALAGGALFIALSAAGVPFFESNPFFGALALVHVCFLISLLVAGVLTLRPDQLPMVYMAKDALRAGRSVLIAHARSTGEMNTIRARIRGARLGFAQTL